MKSLKVLVDEQLRQLSPTGAAYPMLRTRLILEQHFVLLTKILMIVAPRGSWLLEPGCGHSSLFEVPRLQSPAEITESHENLKAFLGVSQLDFSVWIDVRTVFADILNKMQTKPNLDIAICAIREFVRLELGQCPTHDYDACLESPLPEFEPAGPHDECCDEESEVLERKIAEELEADSFGDCLTWGESMQVDWMRYWENALSEKSSFENAMKISHVRESTLLNARRALRPVFELRSVYYPGAPTAVVRVLDLVETFSSRHRLSDRAA